MGQLWVIQSEHFSFRVFQRNAVTSNAPRGKGEAMFGRKVVLGKVVLGRQKCGGFSARNILVRPVEVALNVLLMS